MQLKRWHVSVVVVLFGLDAAPAEEFPATLQRQIEATLQEVLPSVVSISYGKPERHLTGTAVSDGGLILTCGHLKRDIGDEVEVRCAGKKPAAAKVIAKHTTLDVALLQVSGKEKWAAVPLGDSKGLSAQDPLLAVGFGNTGLYRNSPDPPVRYTRLGYLKEQRLWPRKDELLTTVVSRGGDSGGPLFDLAGSLVGSCSRGEADGTETRYVSAEALLREWDAFAKDVPKPPTAPRRRPPQPSAAATMAKAVAGVQPAVVEVQVGDRWVGVGVHVGRGQFLSKASELGDGLGLILADGTVAAAEVAARDPATDLALLELRSADLAAGLPAVRWAEEQDLAEGRMVAAVTPAAFTPPVGVVCLSARPVPPLPGTLPVRVRDGKDGATVAETFAELTTPWLRPPAFPLRAGDVITRVAGQTVRNGDDFRKLLLGPAREVGGHPRVAGEAVEVTWTRDGKAITARIHLRLQQSAATQRVRPYSYRYSGFASVLATDLMIRPEHCGAPVVDSGGRVVGLLIAKAPFIESLVLPGREARAAAERMLKTADRK